MVGRDTLVEVCDTDLWKCVIQTCRNVWHRLVEVCNTDLWKRVIQTCGRSRFSRQTTDWMCYNSLNWKALLCSYDTSSGVVWVKVEVLKIAFYVGLWMDKVLSKNGWCAVGEDRVVTLKITGWPKEWPRPGLGWPSYLTQAGVENLASELITVSVNHQTAGQHRLKVFE